MYCNDMYIPPAVDLSYDIELIYIRIIDDDNIIAMINRGITKTSCVLLRNYNRNHFVSTMHGRTLMAVFSTLPMFHNTS